jgi:hypothetical protein
LWVGDGETLRMLAGSNPASRRATAVVKKVAMADCPLPDIRDLFRSHLPEVLDSPNVIFHLSLGACAADSPRVRPAGCCSSIAV